MDYLETQTFKRIDNCRILLGNKSEHCVGKNVELI